MLALLLRAATWSVPAGPNIFRTAETALPFVPKKGHGIVLVHPTPL